MPKLDLLIPVERIEKSILLIRGQKVILDRELAAIYGVTTKRLNQQVSRNADRFPADFCADAERGCIFEVAICNLKGQSRRAAYAAPGVH